MKAVSAAALAGMLAMLSGCAVYGPPPQVYDAGPYYGSPAYAVPAPGYAYGPPVYAYPAPVYVGPPVSFRFSFGYWSGHRRGFGGFRRRW